MTSVDIHCSRDVDERSNTCETAAFGGRKGLDILAGDSLQSGPELCVAVLASEPLTRNAEVFDNIYNTNRVMSRSTSWSRSKVHQILFASEHLVSPIGGNKCHAS